VDLTVDALRDAERAPVALRTVDGSPFVIEADGPTGHMRAEGHDLFAATLALREQLERDGWLLQIEGARPDVYPSAMSREAGRAYVIRPGRHSTLEDLVDILAPVSERRAGTVAEQRARFEQWSRSERS
jgi:hypothetical protein